MPGKDGHLRFSQVARWGARIAGHPGAFILALTVVLTWAVIGPLFAYSDTWQLVINTGTTIITFLMVFLIQNTQNRDMLAMQVKLDELIRAIKAARNSVLNLEDLEEDELELLLKKYNSLGTNARDKLQRSKKPSTAAGNDPQAPAGVDNGGEAIPG